MLHQVDPCDRMPDKHWDQGKIFHYITIEYFVFIIAILHLQYLFHKFRFIDYLNYTTLNQKINYQLGQNQNKNTSLKKDSRSYLRFGSLYIGQRLTPITL